MDYSYSLACLASRVAWRPSADASLHSQPDQSLSVAATLSESGLFANDLSPLLGMENLAEATAPGQTLEQFVLHLREQGIAMALEHLENQVGLQRRQLVRVSPLVAGSGQKNNTVAPQGRFVGLELALVPHPALTVVLQKVALQLNAANAAPVTLYLYAEGRQQPLATYDHPANEPFSIQWQGLTDWVLGQTNADPSMRFYLGYYEEDLTAEALHKTFTGKSCGCSYDPVGQLSPYLGLRSVSVPASALDAGRQLFDVSQVHISSSNFGLNLALRLGCDIAQLLCAQPGLADRLLQWAVALAAVQAMVEQVPLQVGALASGQQELMALADKAEGQVAKHAAGVVDQLVQAGGPCFQQSRRALTQATLSR